MKYRTFVQAYKIIKKIEATNDKELALLYVKNFLHDIKHEKMRYKKNVVCLFTYKLRELGIHVYDIAETLNVCDRTVYNYYQEALR